MDRDVFLEFLLAYGVLALVLSVKGQVSICSEAERQTHLQHCLVEIKNEAENRTIFWFGDTYPARCDESVVFVADCYNPSPDKADSLVSRVYKDGAYNVTALDRFLNVTFTQSPGSYFGCENDFERQETQAITVDPLSSEVYTPWQLREEPTYNWDYTQGELFTLIFYDVGYMYIKSFVVNIPGNNVTDGEVILSYEGPLNPTRNHNPYLYLLYKQSSKIKLGPSWRNILYQRSATFDLASFVLKHKLTGPVALNWIQVTGDTYAAERKKSSGYMNTCPHFVSDALNSHDLQFLPEKRRTIELSVFLNVTFFAPKMTFNSCCAVYEYPAKTFSLNPLGNGEVKAANARTAVIPTISMSMAKAFPSFKRDFEDKLLTLMVLDADVPFPVFGDKTEPFLHWLVVNIYDGDVTKGDTVYPYIGPAPPSPDPHTYHYLLFEQDYVLHPAEIAEYSNKDCSFPFQGRCRFQSRTVISNHNLQLIGATWHVTKNDEFVRHFYTSLGMRSCEVCSGIEGFSVPCATAGVTNNVATGLVLGILGCALFEILSSRL